MTRRSITGLAQPRSAQARTKSVRFRTTPQLAAAVAAEAKRLRLTVSAWLTKLIEGALR